MTEKTGRALERVKFRVDFDPETKLHTVMQWLNKEWKVAGVYKKYREAIKALNELRGVKK